MNLNNYFFVLLYFFVCVESVIPPEWEKRVEEGQMLFGEKFPDNTCWMPYIGNGFLAGIVLFPTFHVGGVYNGRNNSMEDGPSNKNSHRADIPATLSVQIINKDYSLIGGALDIEKAIFYKRGTLQNSKIEIEERFYAHRVFPNLLVYEIEILNDIVETEILELFLNTSKTYDLSWKEVQTNNVSISAFQGTTLVSETPISSLTTVATYSDKIPKKLYLNSKKKMFTFLSVVETTISTKNPLEMAKKWYQKYSQYSPQVLQDLHIKEWSSIWVSGLEMKGNLTIATSVNSSIYDILSNLREDYIWSISPGGIGNNAYNGHVFWDAETWMFPTFVFLQPNIAKAMLQYRYNRLLEAKSKALWSGNEGASWPWESAFTGYECTCCPPKNTEGILEIHITGDICMAFKKYYDATQDIVWLREIAWPIIESGAQFWVSRVTLENGTYSINDVQCPDESSKHVNNGVYTNVVASLTLKTAISFSKILKLNYDPKWKIISENLKIPFNQKLQIHEEYDGYDGHLINQADVVLLQYPLRYPMSKQVAINDIIYYENVTRFNGYFTGDSAYSIANYRLGRFESANNFWQQSFLHIKPPFNTWTEKVVGGHNHFLTGAGGYLQNVFFGFFGLELNDHNITLNPQFPPYSDVTYMKLREIYYQSIPFSVEYDDKSMKFYFGSGSNQGEPLFLKDSKGTVFQFLPDAQEIPRQNVTIFVQKTSRE